MYKISIIGGGGLAGKELVRLVSGHPGIDIAHITSDTAAGSKMSEVFRDLPVKNNDLTFSRHEDPLPEDSIIVLAVPNQASLDTVPGLLQKKFRVVDFSGAFRLHDPDEFKSYYNLARTNMDTMNEAVFGLPEIYRNEIKNAKLVANPGCYPTSVILPLYALGESRKDMVMVTVNSASGVSGAGGRTEDAGFSFNSVSENFRSYKILGHQHEPEIREYAFAGYKPEFVFTPHLLPVYRGILSTTTILFKSAPDPEKIKSGFERLAAEQFVRIYKSPEEISLKNVVMTNYLDLSWRIRGNTMVMVSAIDNLVKGASGQALQNINLMLGLEETLGLVS